MSRTADAGRQSRRKARKPKTSDSKFITDYKRAVTALSALKCREINQDGVLGGENTGTQVDRG